MKKLLDIARITIWPALGVMLAALAYSSILEANFIGLDDDVYVSQNPMVQQGLTRESIKWAFTAVHASTWQPMVWLSYMLDVELQGFSPASFHRTNLILHSINILLVFFALRLLFNKNNLAGWCALIFAIHPIHVESVAWIAERKGLLSSSFWWLAIIAYVYWRNSRKPVFYLLLFISYILGLMAKPMLMTLPVTLVVLDFWPLKQLSSKNYYKSEHDKLPLLILSICSFLITSYAQHSGGSFIPISEISLWGRVSNAIISPWRYLWQWCFPFNLAVLYPHPGTWPFWLVIPAFTGIVVLLCLGWHYRQRYPWLLAMQLWFGIILFPVLGLTQFGWHAIADRFMYIPAIALCITLLMGLTQLPKAWSWLRPTICGSLLLLYLAQTHKQATLWNNSLSLFTNALEITDNNWMMHNGVGAALSRMNRQDEAAFHFSQVIKLKPDRPKAYFNLGHVRFMQQRWNEAIDHYQKSLQLQETIPTLFNLALAYKHAGQAEEAKKSYLRVLEIVPDHIPALLGLGHLYREDKEWDQAAACYQLVLDQNPTIPDARSGRAVVMLNKGHEIEALADLVQILQEHPDNALAREAVKTAMQHND